MKSQLLSEPKPPTLGRPGASMAMAATGAALGQPAAWQEALVPAPSKRLMLQLSHPAAPSTEAPALEPERLPQSLCSGEKEKIGTG